MRIRYETYKEGEKMKEEERIGIEKAIEIVKGFENPYPKDIFTWDNKAKLDFNRGRFNQFCFELVENIKTILISHLKEEIED